MKIFKYGLSSPGQDSRLHLPIGSGLLTVQLQKDWPTLWVLVDDTQEHTEVVRITCFGTGWDIPDDYRGEYLSTVQETDGYVWHYFFEHGG